MDQSQSSAGSNFERYATTVASVRPARHDPHHGQATCRKRLSMNPNFPDRLLGFSHAASCDTHGGLGPKRLQTRREKLAIDVNVIGKKE